MRAGGTALGKEPALRHLHESGVETVGATDQEGERRHRRNDAPWNLVTRANQRSKAPGHGGERNGGVRGAATVNSVSHLLRARTGELGDRAANPFLHGVRRFEVGFQW